MRQRVLAELRAIRSRLEALEQLLESTPIPANKPPEVYSARPAAAVRPAAPANGQHWRNLPAQASRGRRPVKRRPAATPVAGGHMHMPAMEFPTPCDPPALLRPCTVPAPVTAPRGDHEDLDVAQRSPAWRQARAGRLTASRAHAALTRGRGRQEALARSQVPVAVVVERLTGLPYEDGFVSAAMVRGRELEAAARRAYAARTGQVVRTSGFLLHDELEAGCSLDGHVGDYEGVIEIKAPNTTTHCGYLAAGTVPTDYRDQIRHHLWITGAAWCDFVSYDDRLPAPLQLVVIRLTRAELDIPGYALLAQRFLDEVRVDVERLRARLKGPASARDLVRCLEALECERLDQLVAAPRGWQPALVG